MEFFCIPRSQLDFQHIKAELKKFAARNNFSIKGKIVLQHHMLNFKNRFLGFSAQTKYPVCLVEAISKSNNKSRYFLVYNISSTTADDIIPICENSSPNFEKIDDFFIWDSIKYQKNEEGFKKS